MTLIHGTCVALDGAAVLLRGPPGSGKSDLALRLIDGGGRLIADDQTLVEMRDGRLVASAPETIAGKMEVRGVGVLTVETEESGILGLVVELEPDPPERMPEPESTEILGVALPLLRLNPFEASAAAKLRLAARALARTETGAATGTETGAATGTETGAATGTETGAAPGRTT